MQGKRGSDFPPSRGPPVIVVLDSDDDDKKSTKTIKKETPIKRERPMKKPVVVDFNDDEATMKKSTKTTNKETPIKRERPMKKPIVVDLDDGDDEEEAKVKKSKFTSQPQANSFGFQSSGVSYANGSTTTFSSDGPINCYTYHTTTTVVPSPGGFHGSITTTCVGNGYTGVTNNVLGNTNFSCVGKSFVSTGVFYFGGNGASHITSRATGSNGYTYEESKEADLSTRQATHRVSRGIRNKGHSITRNLKSDGHVDTVETLHNLNQHEVSDFEEEWTENAEKNLPAWNTKASRNRIYSKWSYK